MPRSIPVQRAHVGHRSVDGPGVLAIVIPQRSDRAAYVTTITGSSMAAQQRLVHGTVEALVLQRPDARLCVDEERATHGLAGNARATLLAQAHHRGSSVAGLSRPPIAGPAVLLGPPDADGRETSAPEQFLGLVQHVGRYRMQVTTHDEPGRWAGNELVFEDWPRAYAWGLNLASRWRAVKDVRVVPVPTDRQLSEWLRLATTALEELPGGGKDQPFGAQHILGCYSLEELEHTIAPGAERSAGPAKAVHYRDLCLVNLTRSGPEQQRWIGIRSGVTFEVPALGRAVADGLARGVITRILAAAPQQLRERDF